ECKACKNECPSNVDMAKLKSEALAKHYEAHGVPVRARAFGEIARLSALGQRLAPVTNFMSGLAPVKALTERFLGISRQRPLPRFARRRFTAWFKRHEYSGPVMLMAVPPEEMAKMPPRGTEAGLKALRKWSRRQPQVAPAGEIVLFNDTFTEYMHPEVGQAAVRVLEGLGYRVTLVKQKTCCGRPLISKGQLAKAKDWARINVDALLPYAAQGRIIIGTEPSCLLTLRDEYPDLLQDDASRKVAASALMLDEFLVRLEGEDPDKVRALFHNRPKQDIQVHGHCHQKAIVGTAPTMKALALAGYQAELIDSACCGMAGTFGFEQEHYEISKAMGALKLFPAIEAESKRDWAVAVSGISCRQQIGHFTSKRPRHVAEYLADALR
ncbi:MAG: heterodisulfide reductase-related iron-sulfur binding cluster, partial [Dehalococcoidia bacterium]